jgi:hypothetical protein
MMVNDGDGDDDELLQLLTTTIILSGYYNLPKLLEWVIIRVPRLAQPQRRLLKKLR